MPPETKVPAYKPLPPLGSDERKKLIDDMCKAFGGEYKPGEFSALNPQAIYDQLSQLSYQDRITLLYQVFRKRKQPDFTNDGYALYTGKIERLVVEVLRYELSTNDQGKNTFVGATQFLQLMSDAPQDDYHKTLLKLQIAELKKIPAFIDQENKEVQKPLALLKAYDPTNDPDQFLELIGVVRGKPPLNIKHKLAMTDAPNYKALPEVGSQERKDLVEAIDKAMGKTDPFLPGKPSPTKPHPVLIGETLDTDAPSDPQIKKDFKGIADPDAFFKLMGQFDYKSRLKIYREVLAVRGEEKLAVGSDFEIRQSLMFRLMYTDTNKKSFAGLDKFFRLVADAPRGAETDRYLKDEIDLVQKLSAEREFTDLGREFYDKNEAGVRENFQRFFSVGGVNGQTLPFHFYNKLELIGIPVGKPPITIVQPDKDPLKTGKLDLFQFDTLHDRVYPTQSFGLPTLSEPIVMASMRVDAQQPLLRSRLGSPLAHV